EPLSEWDQTNPDGEHELSSITNGAKIVGYNDAHYGSPWVILAPGRGQNMGDGWETRRRREPGNDWIVVALGAPGLVERIEIDTAYFKGNYPDRCSVQGALVANGVDILQDAETWPELMEQKKLQMDQIHTFDRSAINVSGPVSHVRLNIFPDGGVSRFRVFGKLAKE
ncbi:MAG: allantoicase, partial [Rhodospirillales bacterium]|nr:allantoicase [Rhodospirillales bacterium]